MEDHEVGLDDGEDAPAPLVDVDVAEAAVPAVVDLVVLFLLVVDQRPLSREDLIVGPGADGSVRLIAPDYLWSAIEQVTALATWDGPLPLRPAEVASELLDLAGLISAIRSEAATLELPALTQLFAAVGVPIDLGG
jgi:hypothetical protein